MSADELNVLIVDDDPVARRIARDQLSGIGFRVFLAEDWPTMNQVLFSHRVAVILMDVKLPGLSGDMLADVVRRNMSPSPRILLYSGMGREELERLTRSSGADGFVTKGVSLYTLRSAVREQAEQWKAEHAERTTGGATSSPGSPVSTAMAGRVLGRR